MTVLLDSGVSAPCSCSHGHSSWSFRPSSEIPEWDKEAPPMTGRITWHM